MAGGGGLGVIALALLVWALGGNPMDVLQAPGAIQNPGGGEITEADRRAGEFVSVVLADTEEVWVEQFRANGLTYRPPVLVLYKGVTSSPCGGASGATGPFYCPGDRKVYLDTAFFATMEQRLGAGGDFAAAYVVAHEVAHHVENELGILGQANALRARGDAAEANAVSVRIELMADCLSGVWARHAEAMFGTIERGDIAEAMNAARQIGDDTLQRNAGRVPMPHTFTHGTSEQRQRWFATGYDRPEIGACDTFSAGEL